MHINMTSREEETVYLTTDSPFDTLSPGFFSHDTIFPSVIVELSAGIKISFTAAMVETHLLLEGRTMLA